MNLFRFMQAIAKESPHDKKFKEEEVGARTCPASATLGSKIFIFALP